MKRVNAKSFVKAMSMVIALISVVCMFASASECASKPSETPQKSAADSTQAAGSETKKDPYDFDIPKKEKNMYKVVRFLRKLPGNKPEEFAAHWTNEYGAAFTKLTTSNPGFIRYSQNHRLIVGNGPSGPALAAVGEYDVIDELWFENKAAADALFSSKEYQETLLPIQAKYIDAKQSLVATGNTHVMWARSATPKADKFKVIIMGSKKPDLSVEEFTYHWFYVHSPLAKKAPGFREHVQRQEFHPAERMSYTGLQPADSDGTNSCWFDSIKDMQAEFSSDYYFKNLAPDEKKFGDAKNTHVQPVNEVVIWTSSKW